VAVAERLRGFVRPDDLVCRLGGDEFVLVTTGIEPEAVDGLIGRVEQRLQEPVAVAEVTHRVGASIGVAWIDPLGGVPSDDAARNLDAELDQALDEADRNMLQVKAQRRDPTDRDHLLR
jgi:diguanylate cyclase (GGDEF)-like protein